MCGFSWIREIADTPIPLKYTAMCCPRKTSFRSLPRDAFGRVLASSAGEALHLRPQVYPFNVLLSRLGSPFAELLTMAWIWSLRNQKLCRSFTKALPVLLCLVALSCRQEPQLHCRTGEVLTQPDHRPTITPRIDTCGQNDGACQMTRGLVATNPSAG